MSQPTPRPRPPMTPNRRGGVITADRVIATDHRQRDAAEQHAIELHEAMDSRASIERAKGVLVERHAFTPQDAYRLLADLSQYTGVRVRMIAEVLLSDHVAAPDGGRLPRLRWVCRLLNSLPQPAMLLVPEVGADGTISSFTVHHVNSAATAELPAMTPADAPVGRSDIPVARLLTMDNAIVVRWRAAGQLGSGQ